MNRQGTLRALPAHDVHPVQAELERRTKGVIRTESSTTYVVNIDQDLARSLLALRPEWQRNIRRTHVRKLVAAMDGGQYRPVGDPIRLDTAMQLIDGQHRCTATIEARAGFVLRDQPVMILRIEDAFFSIDQGAERTTTDHLKAAFGERQQPGIRPGSSEVSGIVWEHCDFKPHAKNLLTKEQQVRIAIESPFLDAVRITFSGHRAPAGIIAGAIRCMRVDVDLASEFFQAAVANRHTVHGAHSEPLRHLATWLANTQGRGYSGYQFVDECAYRAIRAWNDFRRNHVPKMAPKYRISKGGESGECTTPSIPKAI